MCAYILVHIHTHTHEFLQHLLKRRNLLKRPRLKRQLPRKPKQLPRKPKQLPRKLKLQHPRLDHNTLFCRHLNKEKDDHSCPDSGGDGAHRFQHEI
jgi:hypothetical protein